ncbi:putative LRR receptor-like serine/threonine-protein kinase [Prunus yedoensis var. nudiflora]|uniref:Putative LRR receptor-like serine/threonine-protein kinase n=1 Tax=Prunus yedoensis var. nudiflora TaxID=2094558 RepID=A0A314ZXY1_PRUYE|nr:putative LRR receptor-like serine/threonine-protein kinase [Prunus yedoensis var. nudiflora]
MIDVASALEYLYHGNSVPIIHCDIKPSNILLDDDMVAHVADFGIAKLVGVGESTTQTMTLATIGYMAPGLTFNCSQICNAVAVASLLNATLVLPRFLYSNVWNDPRQLQHEGMLSTSGDVYSFEITATAHSTIKGHKSGSSVNAQGLSKDR